MRASSIKGTSDDVPRKHDSAPGEESLAPSQVVDSTAKYPRFAAHNWPPIPFSNQYLPRTLI